MPYIDEHYDRNGTPDWIYGKAEDSYEAIDWLKNNMNWPDVEAVAVQVSTPSKQDALDDWYNQPMKIVGQESK